jgi:hypothetical protein
MSTAWGIFIGLILWWAAYASVKTGQQHGIHGALVATRADHPIMFWVLVVVDVLAGLGLMVAGCLGHL